MPQIKSASVHVNNNESRWPLAVECALQSGLTHIGGSPTTPRILGFPFLSCIPSTPSPFPSPVTSPATDSPTEKNGVLRWDDSCLMSPSSPISSSSTSIHDQSTEAALLLLSSQIDEAYGARVTRFTHNRRNSLRFPKCAISPNSARITLSRSVSPTRGVSDNTVRLSLLEAPASGADHLASVLTAAPDSGISSPASEGDGLASVKASTSITVRSVTNITTQQWEENDIEWSAATPAKLTASRVSPETKTIVTRVPNAALTNEEKPAMVPEDEVANSGQCGSTRIVTRRSRRNLERKPAQVNQTLVRPSRRGDTGGVRNIVGRYDRTTTCVANASGRRVAGEAVHMCGGKHGRNKY